MNEKDAQSLAKKLKERHAIAEAMFWSEEALEIWLRCDCRCVYCGRDMLASRDIAYQFSSTAEHLLPKSKNRGLEAERSNLVLSCRPCNHLKGTWDPNLDGESIYADGQLREEQRQELIQRVKAYLNPLRKKNEDHFVQEKNAILEALMGY
jgi:5-methylcytosine-specific restriction endonuclease McrA